MRGLRVFSQQLLASRFNRWFPPAKNALSNQMGKFKLDCAMITQWSLKICR
jgi:hypothetical membrane protein